MSQVLDLFVFVYQKCLKLGVYKSFSLQYNR